MPILLHPLAAFVLGDFSFASFFERTHSGKINWRGGEAKRKHCLCRMANSFAKQIARSFFENQDHYTN